MNWKQVILRFLNRRGYQLVRFPVKPFLYQGCFDVVIDVGANTGQFATELRREFGYKNRIISFEPLSDAFEILNRNAEGDSKWEVINSALGSRTEKSIINIAGNSASSSLMEMLPRHSEAAPHTAMVSSESVDVKKLDDIFSELIDQNERVLLKIDTQGFEMEVLEGANRSLEHVTGILIELNLCPLYAGAPMAETVLDHLRSAGFEPYGFVHGFRDPRTQQLLQMDGYFIRPKGA